MLGIEPGAAGCEARTLPLYEYMRMSLEEERLKEDLSAKLA